MPSATEILTNRALTNEELKVIIRAACEQLIEAEGMLSSHASFGRVAYQLTLKLHLDNPMFSESTTLVESRLIAKQLVEADPKLSAIEAPPLKAPSGNAEVYAHTLNQTIDNPNAERLRHGMPVPVDVPQQDGTHTTEHIKYPQSVVDDMEVPPEQIEIQNTGNVARRDWNLPPTPEDLQPPVATPKHLSEECKCGHPKGRHALSGVCTICNDDRVCGEFRSKDAPEAKTYVWEVKPS